MKARRLFSRVGLVAATSLTLPLYCCGLAKGQEDAAFLWAIESPNNTVYLLGSVHVLREADYPLPQPMQTAFEEAENVVFEVDIAELESPSSIQTVLQAAMPDSDEEVLNTALTPETYALATEAASSVGLPMVGFDNFEPWFFSISLVSLKLAQLGFEADHGVDNYLYNQASSTGRDVLALETIEEQIGFLDGLSPQVQVDFVEQTVLELDILESSFNVMLNAWKSGDVDSFEQVTLEGFTDYPEVYETFLAQRNRNWLPDIESFINQPEDYLVVVGAAHLVGEDSVINLLQARGYTVQQVGTN
ncbi:MAG: TraB/GumN family protein [Cyanobacteria bacterium J06636_16]